MVDERVMETCRLDKIFEQHLGLFRSILRPHESISLVALTRLLVRIAVFDVKQETIGMEDRRAHP